MPHRLLIIDQPSPSPLSAAGFWEPNEVFQFQHTNWNCCPPSSILQTRADLIVAVAVAEPEKAKGFFHWLREHPLATPTLGILSNEADEALLRAACETMADFMLWPAALKELHHRVQRLLGPPCDDTERTIQILLKEELGRTMLVGQDTVFRQVVNRIPQIAASDAPVMLLGETGTGKELCAQAIHHLSKRHSFPFVPVDCGAVPENLVENELFGHTRGAYTDAHSDQKGLVGIAQGGTLFLDEIDALSLGAQAKLLRFLQEGTYRPLGSERFLRAQVRVVAATNRDLEACVREQRFRSDLYFRLNVLHLRLPPLRERRGDITLLARYFLERASAAEARIKSFSPAALRSLEAYEWPGNVRELFNVVQRALIYSPGHSILPSHLSLPTTAEASESQQLDFRRARSQVISDFEGHYVRSLLRKHGGNVTRAAHEAGKERRAFGRLVKKYGIDRQQP